MPRIDLHVPFAEKDEAKRLGAHWDVGRKVWFVPEGVDPSVFERWLPSEPNISIRAGSYFIAQTQKSCWKCGELTRVYGLALPAGHETLGDVWMLRDEPTIVYYVTDLFPAAAARIKAFSRHYRIDFSKTTQSSYWMNHCELCGMKQGDFEMYSEPQGAFFPTNGREASLIVLHAVREPFGCNGEYSYGVGLFDYMRRA